MINCDMDLNACYTGESPLLMETLFIASEIDTMQEFAIEIIKGGANVNLHYGSYTPLQIARDNDLKDIVELLLQYGALEN